MAFHKVPIYECDSTEAEMVKYVTNVHLAVKVSLVNEFIKDSKEVLQKQKSESREELDD